MLLTISTTHRPATDLGHLLRKNPANTHRRDLAFGQALVFYPEVSETRCRAALMIDVDPIALVRGRKDRRGRNDRKDRDANRGDRLLDHYVNDRPYAASSFLSVAIARAFREAMAGIAPERPDLAQTPIPLELMVTPLPCRGGDEIVERLFAPLGYEVEIARSPLDPSFPDWGDSPYRTLTLRGTLRLADALTHLYVLIPVLDDAKHYWVGDDEVQKLIARGGAWLQTHPERDLVADRYLRRKRYVRDALAVLDEKFGLLEDAEPEDEGQEENALERPMGLNQQRYEAVIKALARAGAQSVCDLGCGDGKFLARLMKEKTLSQIVGVEVSTAALEMAERRLKVHRMAPAQRARIDLRRGSLVYEDDRLQGLDAITLVEVIEHVDRERLGALERVVFQSAAPSTVIVSTPNRDYNVTFETMAPGQLRHHDHRFEWGRAAFQDWANGVGARQGYGVVFEGIGDVHADRKSVV